jgi:hypothetical protein
MTWIHRGQGQRHAVGEQGAPAAAAERAGLAAARAAAPGGEVALGSAPAVVEDPLATSE